MSDDVQNVIDQLFKLLRCNLIKDPSDPTEYRVILDLFFFLGKFVSSSRSWNPSLLLVGAG